KYTFPLRGSIKIQRVSFLLQVLTLARLGLIAVLLSHVSRSRRLLSTDFTNTVTSLLPWTHLLRFVSYARRQWSCPNPSITEFRHLASYNWIESPTPTIAVPGSPAKWSPPRGPIQVKKGTGYFYAAQNVARHPESPLEPLFRALLLTDSLVDLRSVGVVTGRNNI
ncbi:hypothetical protein QL093DRAFT_2108666, partial [Fusarium oxysporum]